MVFLWFSYGFPIFPWIFSWFPPPFVAAARFNIRHMSGVFSGLLQAKPGEFAEAEKAMGGRTWWAVFMGYLWLYIMSDICMIYIYI